MSKPFRSSAFARWVPEFVTCSHRQSGILRQPSVAEIAAYRGLFALERIGVENVSLFLHHVVGPCAGPVPADPQWCSRLLELNAPGLEIDVWADRFRAHRPLLDGNGRCARALHRWYQLRGDELGTSASTDMAAGPRPPKSGDPRALLH